MRYLLIVILAMSMGMTACSKKKSSSVATAPATNDNTDNGGGTNNPSGCTSNCNPGVIPNMPAPYNGSYYVGKVKNITKSTYKKFLKAGLGVYSDGGQFGDGYSYSWNYQCDFNIFALIFDGQGFNCSTQQSQFEQYITDMANAPAMITLTFYKNGTVEGNWLVDAYQDYYGYIDYYMGIPFKGKVFKLTDGRYLIEAGPLSLVTTSPSARTSFNTYFYDGNSDLQFGTVTVK